MNQVAARKLLSRAVRAVLIRGHAALGKIGHFDAPWPDPAEAAGAITRAEHASGDPIPGVDIDDGAMLQLWSELAALIEKAPFPSQKGDITRYYYDNSYFTFFDAQIYFAMIGHFRPKNIVEIGSGFSSAVALDARDHFATQTRFTFIEPNAGRLRSLLRENDYTSANLRECKIQDADLEIFTGLGADDILFIDSSHVLKTGSDVCFELFEILPMLRPGVIVHFHDISAGFEYPRQWVLDDRRGWNEAHAVRAFLMYNSAFKIIFFNDYFGNKFPARLNLPQQRGIFRSGGSLWLQRQ